MPASELIWVAGIPALNVLMALFASGHAVLYKRDARAAIGWCGVIWLAPFVGSGLYLLLGVNRIQRRAHALRGDLPDPDPAQLPCPAEPVQSALGEEVHLEALARLVGRVTGLPLVGGNELRPLEGGDVAYPAMLAAIDAAEASVTLSTYIFDNDAAGATFVDALSAAVRRGVAVRVLIDGVGVRYSVPSVMGALRRGGVQAARFLPTLVPWRLRYSNMRNHRKLLVVDGQRGFTGGMNIREGNVGGGRGAPAIQDLHFAVSGPVVTQLQEAFVQDWGFAAGEVLTGAPWFQAPRLEGQALARAVPDGPDEDFDKLRMTLLGALSCAQRSIQVVTPYFVPDATLLTSLNLAALRGVSVDIVLPARNNLRLVQWASMAILWQILERGCRVWLSPPPFDHTKLMLVDGAWTFLGSANWDARSLRLNFELNVECYDRALAESLAQLVEKRLAAARPLTFEEVEGRSLFTRLRDGTARLLTPYL